METVKICECVCESNREMKARMREKMMECSRNGDINGLYSTIEEYPEMLKDIDKIQFVNTPLHAAAAAGSTKAATEILNLMPSFGKKLNPQGLSPLHVAIETGHIDTALALVEIDKQLGLVKGKEGLTPLHYVAKRPMMNHDGHNYDESTDQRRTLVGLLLACPDSVDVVTNRLQTAIHVAAEYGNFEAVHLLVNWLITRQKESVLSKKDEDRNTALHIIAAHPDCDRKPENLDLLKMLVKIVKVNKQNKHRQTPLDVATTSEAKEVLEKAGGRSGNDLGKKPSTLQYLLKKHAYNSAEALTRWYYFLIVEMTLDMRNTILVIAVLIATATYQGVLSPPGGVYSADSSTTSTTTTGRRLSDDSDDQTHLPGRMVMAMSHYIFFMPTNTLAFILSNVIIIFVLPSCFFVIILQVVLLLMCLSYLLALNFISHSNEFSDVLLFVSSCIIVISFLLKMAYYILKALYSGKVWWLHRVNVMASNGYDRYFARKCPWSRHTRSSISSSTEEDEMSVCTRMRKQYKLITTA